MTYDKINKWQCHLQKLKNKNCQNIKRLTHSIYFSLRSNASKSVSLFSFFCYSFIKIICKIRLNTFVTIYTDTLSSNFAHIIILKVAHSAILTIIFFTNFIQKVESFY